MKMTPATILILSLAVPAIADDRPLDPGQQARVLAPFLSAQTIAVAYIDADRLDLGELWKVIAALEGQKANDREQPVNRWFAEFKRAGGHDLYAIMDLADFPQNPPMLVAPVATATDPQPLIRLMKRAAEELWQQPLQAHVCEKMNDVVFSGTKATSERIRTGKSVANTNLNKAFAAAAGAPVQVLLVPSSDTRRVIEEMFPVLPGAIGGGSGKIITQGIKWAAVGLRQAPQLSLELVIQSDDAGAAERLSKLLGKILKTLAQRAEVKQAVPNIEELAERLTPQVKDDRVVIRADEKTLTPVLQPIVSRTEEATRRTSSSNRLKQIGLALHSYHDVHKSFPPAAKCKDGKRLLSWRVLILPFVEQQKLYEEFHLDEPWDSEHNRQLIPRMPPVFRSAASLPAGKTTYLGIGGDSGVFPGCEGIAIRDITDGTSNTIAVVDADDARAVEWTKPDDLTPDFSRPMEGLVGHYPQGFLALFCDASVRFMSKAVSPQILKAYFTRNGGEVIQN